MDSINTVIKQSYSHDFDIRFYLDTANVYIDDINFNQLQQLLIVDKAFTNRPKVKATFKIQKKNNF